MILEIADSINGVPVRLTEERWEHILTYHLELSDIDMDLILDAVKDPEYILIYDSIRLVNCQTHLGRFRLEGAR